MDSIQVFKKLIRFNTSNPPGDELLALEYIQSILAHEGMESTIYETAKQRGNLIAYLPPQIKSSKTPLVLLSHIDVVTADASEWTYDPFGAQEVNGYIYGRGTVDTKELTVMHLSAFIALQSKKDRNRDVYLVITCDEENGSHFGLQQLLKDEIVIQGNRILGKEIFNKAVVLSEGGGFPIYISDKIAYLCEVGQKGRGQVKLKIQAEVESNIYLPSVEALKKSSQVTKALEEKELESHELITVKYFKEAIGLGQLSPMMQNILKAMEANTLAITMVDIMSQDQLELTIDIRMLPGYERSKLETWLNEFCQDWNISYEICDFSQGYEGKGYEEILEVIEKITIHTLGSPADLIGVIPFVSTGSSDGRFLQSSQATVLGYSPVHVWDMTFDEAISLVHGVDERIAVDSLSLGCEILEKVVSELT